MAHPRLHWLRVEHGEIKATEFLGQVFDSPSGQHLASSLISLHLYGIKNLLEAHDPDSHHQELAEQFSPNAYAIKVYTARNATDPGIESLYVVDFTWADADGIHSHDPKDMLNEG